MSAKRGDALANLKRELAEAHAERDQARAERDAAVGQQIATAEVLQVINASPGDLAPVFETMLEKALDLCTAAFGVLWTYDGGFTHAAAVRGATAAYREFLSAPHRPGPGSAQLRLIRGESFVHVTDLADSDDYRSGEALPRALVDLGGGRSLLAVPLRKDGAYLGAIMIYRQQPSPFSDKQIALLQNFAAQAVIAMENARLITETQDALERQTATSEVLETISSSPGRLEPVFEAVLASAVRICGGKFGLLALCDGDGFKGVAAAGLSRELSDNLSRLRHPPQGTGLHRLQETLQTVQVADCSAEPAYNAVRAQNPLMAAVRTALHVPMLKEGALLGAIMIYRDRVAAFVDKEVELVEGFAKQAVIAIENARLIAETQEALDQQTATAEVLGVINSSPGNLAPVFDALLEKAMRLCEAAFGELRIYDGELFLSAAIRGVPAAFAEFRKHNAAPAGAGSLGARILRGQRVVHVLDLKDEEPYRAGDKNRRGLVDLGGARTALVASLKTDDAVLGFIILYRQEVRAFTDKQIALLENFAAQAVIAMENARLITETREALEQQTATAEVLGVINSSPGNLAPVFDATLEKAVRLCEASCGVLLTWDGNHFHRAAWRGVPTEMIDATRGVAIAPQSGGVFDQFVRGAKVISINDLAEEIAREAGPADLLVRLGGARSWVGVALRHDDELLGLFAIYRQEVRAFSNKQIALLENFAAQAVIAMENARLITETRDALEQQTATAEVLRVINASPGELRPVFDAMLEKALALCNASFGQMVTYDGAAFRAAAWHGYAPQSGGGTRPLPGMALYRLVQGEQVVQIADITADEVYRSGNPARRRLADEYGARTAIWVALRTEATLAGAFVIYRTEVRPFADKQIALLQNFAQQAVIAIENARLLTETREALEQQTATSEVLQVISRSTFDLNAVLKTVVSTARRLCRADYSVIFRNQGGDYRFASGEGNVPEYEERERLAVIRPGRGTIIGRAALERRAVQILDALVDPEYTEKDAARTGGAHTMLGVPLLREGEVIGALGLARNRIEAFGDREVELVATFADQAVIAIENARLLTETREARDDAESALRDLTAAQANLVQAQKMAALGQLTAGIAHEIKNPLNFVNNFASLSVELLDELKETAAPALTTLDDDKRADVDETIELLTGNLEKIAEHGKRADNIVKSMLEHSRGASGERREVDLNEVIEEALNLAYHGARAQDQSFNITLERDYAATLKPIELAPQEMTRVFLNLFGNGFYATTKRARENGDRSFRPVITVATRETDHAVEVRVRDNGTGIPPEIRDKLFQPFFTTKPTGEGTGLGLSISYDIVTQQHRGTITVESEPGAYTEFTIRLPR